MTTMSIPTLDEIFAKLICLARAVPFDSKFWWFQRACGRSLTDYSERGPVITQLQVDEGILPTCPECLAIIEAERTAVN